MTIYRGVGGSGDSATGEDVFGDNSSITSLNGISGAIQTPTYIKFAADANHTANQGELTWNTAEGTLDLGLNHGGVVLQIGQELHYRVTNQSGSNIPDGTLVAFVGTTGNSGKLLIDVYDGTQASKAILGLTTETIVNGTNGYVTSFGKVRGIQTNGANYGETWVDGDILYPSPTGLTKVLPQAPAAKQPVAVVVNAHGSNGELFVRIQNSTTLGEDELVQLSSLTNNDILQYDAVDGRFENRSLSSAGIQPTLVSGTTIKTVDGNNILGSGNIDLLAPTDIGVTVQAYDVDTTKNDVANTFTQQQTIDNNLVFTGTGRRITGDFSNATIANRVLFQTSTVNGVSSVGVIPNGTSKFSQFAAWTGSSANESVVGLSVDGTGAAAVLASDRVGTGTYLPMAFYTGGSEKVRITTNGGVAFNGATNYGTTGQLLKSNGDAPPTWVDAATLSVSDGDKGDITVSSGGTVWTVDNDTITYAKIQNVSATDKVLGRFSAGSGDIEEITCTAAGRALLDDLDATAQRTTLGLGALATQGDGDKGDISVSASGTTWTIDNNAITEVKIDTDAVTTTKVKNASITNAKLSLSANDSNIKTAINASGNAPIYACRAWVNFNGTGTVAIRASGNVTSITDNGTGDYTINFTFAMPDANYTWVGSCKYQVSGTFNNAVVGQSPTVDPTTSALRVVNTITNTPSATDAPFINIAVFR